MDISSKVICIVIILVMQSFENSTIEIVVWMQSLQNVYTYIMCVYVYILYI